MGGGLQLTVQGVSHSYQSLQVLDGIDLVAEPGRVLVLVGPSGCGKSTLLKLVAGLLRPSEGEVRVNGRLVERPHGAVGIVFQSPLLLPWRSVRRNVVMPAEVRRLKRAEYEARAQGLLAMTGLAAFADSYPWQLSGGMQQRAAICRALVHDPDILLMDEPFGALDALTRETMNLELQRIQAETAKTVLLITHSIPEAVFLADRVVVMTERPGAIAAMYEVGLARPRSLDAMGEPLFAQLARQVRGHFHAQGRLD